MHRKSLTAHHRRILYCLIAFLIGLVTTQIGVYPIANVPTRMNFSSNVYAAEKAPSIIAMYNWNEFYTKKSDLYHCPCAKERLTWFDVAAFKKHIADIVSYFENPNALREVFAILTDDDIRNEELSAVIITEEHLFFRIITKDAATTKMPSKSRKNLEKFGSCYYYLVSLKPDPQVLDGIKEILSSPSGDVSSTG
jgi:hypothetical protein